MTCGPFCFNWVLIAIRLFVHGINPQAGWLWILIPNTVWKLLCRCWSHETELASTGFSVCWDLLVDILLVKLIVYFSVFCLKLAARCVVYGTFQKYSGIDVCQMLPVTGPGQHVWNCRWSTAYGSLFGLEYVKKRPSCTLRLTFSITGPRAVQQKFKNI